jgi:hypothetical protein
MATTEEKFIHPPEEIVSHTRSIEIGDDMKLTDEAQGDIGWDLYQAALQMDPVEREAIAKRVKMKLDFILLPLVSSKERARQMCKSTRSHQLMCLQMSLIYLVSFLDKTSLNYANAYGLQKDLHFVGRK